MSGSDPVLFDPWRYVRVEYRYENGTQGQGLFDHNGFTGDLFEAVLSHATLFGAQEIWIEPSNSAVLDPTRVMARKLRDEGYHVMYRNEQGEVEDP